ncbi:transposase [Candidatus Viridilinea mediisalina]|uniref:Transposase IS200-like domain-containing protein n=1 Tax=Candidatus Viridilinea mediisalina TaxID=2024553 RepID=A0A2A6REJ3_9CHLR|nr:transposase [Candidatus Viridilinea mediisalina]PDW01181.1 hypothetical protein CJ255_19520 [Candidatus Viridilinea mediisalina]
MPYDPERHHRRSLRLRGYDYRQSGCYFVTICTYQRQPLFAKPSARAIAEQQWLRLTDAGRRGRSAVRVGLDAWVVMPDHVHGIIVLTPSVDRFDPPDGATGESTDDQDEMVRTFGLPVAPGSLGAIVRSYKAAVARRLQGIIGEQRKVWQRNYHDRVVRDEPELVAIRHYIEQHK